MNLGPLVSFIIACKNVGPYLRSSVQSALSQTHQAIEVFIVDDGSTDNTVLIAKDLASVDDRVTLLVNDGVSGPAAARNVGLDHARGEWVAILDADDFIHPERIRRLLAMAQEFDADIIADDLLAFDQHRTDVRCLFNLREPKQLTLAEYIDSNRLFQKSVPFGYAKPLIRRDRLIEHSLRYDVRLRIAEDYDFLARAMSKGMSLWIVPDVFYFYRRHAGSISHRLNVTSIQAMIKAQLEFQQAYGDVPGDPVTSALSRRLQSLNSAQRFQQVIDLLKGRELISALGLLARSPEAWRLMVKSATEIAVRALSPSRPHVSLSPAKRATIISRQRIIGATNGSSAYLLSIASALKHDGWSVNLLAPTPKTFGRMPFAAFSRDLDVFDKIQIRGCLLFGHYLLRLEPVVYVRAARAFIEKLARRLHFNILSSASNPLPHSISLPWEPVDLKFIAKNTMPSEILLADYVFQNFALPYALQNDARTFVLMHDLYATRAGSFKEGGVRDSIAISTEAELQQLALAKTVIAIQPEEAAYVAAHAPQRQVVTVPMPARFVDAAQPGQDGLLLFVGSNAPPNVLAMRWWLDEIWPVLASRNPTAHMVVAGSVKDAGLPSPERVKFMGVVPDLSKLYVDAGLVVSPLTAGSGLKIKLVEALGMGKAIVATSKTLEGVPLEVSRFVRSADTAEAFVREVEQLLFDRSARVSIATAALSAARAHYSQQACRAALLKAVNLH